MSKFNPLRNPMLCANGGPMKCRKTCDECREIEGAMSEEMRREETTKAAEAAKKLLQGR